MQYELKIPYRLNNKGRKSCLFSGDNAKSDQEVSGTISHEDILHSMIVIDGNGYPQIDHIIELEADHLLSFGEAWKLAASVHRYFYLDRLLFLNCLLFWGSFIAIVIILAKAVYGFLPESVFEILIISLISIMLTISFKYIVKYFLDKPYRMGVIARERGKTINDNPFSKELNKKSWNDGWIDANISDVRA